MPAFRDSATTTAPPEEVWKILYDPGRFPEWWTGVGSVETAAADGSRTPYTMYPDGYPDFPMPQLLRTDRAAGRITISCQVSDIDVTWQLADTAPGTAITVRSSRELSSTCGIGKSG